MRIPAPHSSLEQAANRFDHRRPIADRALATDDVWVAGEIRVNANKMVAGIAHYNGKSWGKPVALPDAGDALEVDDGRFEFIDPQPPTQPARFYRSRE